MLINLGTKIVVSMIIFVKIYIKVRVHNSVLVLFKKCLLHLLYLHMAKDTYVPSVIDIIGNVKTKMVPSVGYV